MRTRRTRLALVLMAAIAIVASGCSDDDPETSTGGDGEGYATITVPGDHDTIQAAVDAAAPGDLVLIGPGIYHEAVDVTTEDLTIRGTDRNEVILDGEFELENGFRILDTDGVAIENMTARNYTSNGFFWTGVRRLPRLVPHRLPQRRLRHLRVRLGARASSTTARLGQPRRRLLHRRVLPV